MALRAGLSRANEQLFGYGDVPVPALESYRFIVGRVINNSLARPRNFLTINRGSADGVCADMGVVDQNGVVGIVNVVGEHASRVISVLNVVSSKAAMRSALYRGTGGRLAMPFLRNFRDMFLLRSAIRL